MAPGPLTKRLQELSDPFLLLSPAQQASAFTKMDEAFAQCMREKGFEYTPRVFSIEDVIGDDDPALGDPAYAAAHGFGIVDSWIEALSERDTDHVDKGAPDPRADLLRPDSAAYRESIAYNEARYGPELTGIGGCEEHRMITPSSNYQRFMEAYAEELDNLEQRIHSDPRLVIAKEELARCRAEEGLAGDPFNEVATLLAEVVGGVVPTAIGAEERQVLLDRLRELRAVEVAIAVADSRCLEAYAGVEDQVVADHEQRFIDRPEVAALLIEDPATG